MLRMAAAPLEVGVNILTITRRNVVPARLALIPELAKTSVDATIASILIPNAAATGAA